MTSINDDSQTITVYNRVNNTSFEEHYDTLILSSANSLNLNGPIAFTLRNMEDTDAIETFIEQQNVNKALVVGTGYIGLEILDNLYERGITPTLIHRSTHINKLMDQDMNQAIIDEMDKRHIHIALMKK